MSLSGRQMHEIYNQTVVVRRPTYGIVSGYHELPYVCIGQSLEPRFRTTEVRGRIHVSPRFVIRPPHMEPSYEDVFGQENVDGELSGRIFGFFGFRGKPVECKSEYLEVSHCDLPVESALDRTMDQLARQEDLTTGVIITPDARYYPVSLERFISSVIEDEFGG